MKNRGILYVFPVFHTAPGKQKITDQPQTIYSEFPKKPEAAGLPVQGKGRASMLLAGVIAGVNGKIEGTTFVIPSIRGAMRISRGKYFAPLLALLSPESPSVYRSRRGWARQP